MKRQMKMCVMGLLAVLGLALAGCNGASEIARERLNQDGNHGFLTKTLHRGWWTRKYAVFVPKSYRPGTTQRYPVIIFLHGVGEGAGLGEGDLKNLTVGLGPAVARKADTFDFIVIFPQSDGGWNPNSDYTEDMFTALANTAREYPIDPDRVYLTGLSTGGYGTWAIGAKYHDNFAALVPMGSNGSNQSDAEELTHVAVRAYCSGFGDMFAGWNDENMVKRIKELNPSANAQFISTPTLGHDCWENVYGGDELYTWLKNQRRSGVPAVAEAKKGELAVAAARTPAMPPLAAAPKPAPVAQPAPQPMALITVPAPHATPAAPRPAQPAAPAASAQPMKPAPPAASGGAGEWVNTPW